MSTKRIGSKFTFKSTLPLQLLLVTFAFMSHVEGDIVQYVLQKVSAWQDLETAIYWALPYFETPLTGENLTLSNQNKSQHVQFYLYTDQASLTNPTKIDTSTWDGFYDSFYYSRFNPANPTKFFIHGFGQNYKRPYPQEAIRLYINGGYKYNLIAVNWGDLSMNSSVVTPTDAFENYLEAVENVPIVGQTVGNIIYGMLYYQLTTLDKVHIVGFSLGAHVSGWAGGTVKNITQGQMVARITGMDPAGPLFRTGSIGRHLTKNDSHYVDFIHTDEGQSGTVFDYGHANYFVNGGFPPQPGCLSETVEQGFFDAIPIVLSGSCSHNKAPQYWSLSIKHPKWRAQNCSSYALYQSNQCKNKTTVPFGESSLPGTRGKYYINIDAKNQTEAH